GSIGPTRSGTEDPIGLEKIYREQLSVLINEGVDAVLLETFRSIEHALALVALAKEMAPGQPLVAEMALRMKPETLEWEQDPRVFVQGAHDRGADVVGVNCCAPWEATAFLDAIRDLPQVRDARVMISAMPNAGGFQRIGHRYMTHVNSEYMGKLARTFASKGVHLIGGCCEVHPQHLTEMSNYLHGFQAGEGTVVHVPPRTRPTAGDDAKLANGPFSRKIKAGQFAVSVETLPPRGTSKSALAAKIEFVNELADSGLADALDITDGSRGIPLVPPADFVSAIREELSWTRETGDRLEFIPHFSTRDLNSMGVQSRLIGYYVRRIHNVLFITGDPPKMSPGYPRSTAVFDLDSISMVRYTHAYLNAGLDLGGESLGRGADPRTHFTIGSGFEPEAVNRERELERLKRKIDAGSDYIFTQPVFRREALAILDSVPTRPPILIGVMILGSLEQAQRMAQVPGVVVPDDLLDRFGKYESPEDQLKLGQEVAIEQIKRIREQGRPGIYLMSPASHKPVIPVLKAALA
ncbi:MAG: homocysteine S-methyltransferase family protein, partial [Chloroflexi bacterium]|nr:homocysteine S-methyltransferase family protein [Chloroflexota bacterium]